MKLYFTGYEYPIEIFIFLMMKLFSKNTAWREKKLPLCGGEQCTGEWLHVEWIWHHQQETPVTSPQLSILKWGNRGNQYTQHQTMARYCLVKGWKFYDFSKNLFLLIKQSDLNRAGIVFCSLIEEILKFSENINEIKLLGKSQNLHPWLGGGGDYAF